MTTLAQVRDLIKNTLKANIANLVTHDTVPTQTQVPAVIVVPVKAVKSSFRRGGFDEFHLDVLIVSSQLDSGVAQTRLDNLIDGPNSVPEVLFTNPLADDLALFVDAMSGYGGGYNIGGTPHLGAVLRVRVIRT